MNLGMKTLAWLTEFAVLEGSAAQSLLAWQPTDVELPSGEKMRQNVAWKFEFNEHGKIGKFTQELDTTALIADVGKRNIATVLRMFDSAKLLLKGNAYSPALMSQLARTLANMYAPAIDCSMSSSSSSGFDLKGVPSEVCVANFQAFLGGAKQLDFNVDAIAAVPSSGGTTVLLWQKSALEIAGLPLTMNIPIKMDFNSAGLITGYSEEWDTSAVLETRARAASLASRLSLVGPGRHLALPGFLAGCVVGALPLVGLAVYSRRQGPSEGYHTLTA